MTSANADGAPHARRAVDRLLRSHGGSTGHAPTDAGRQEQRAGLEEPAAPGRAHSTRGRGGVGGLLQCMGRRMVERPARLHDAVCGQGHLRRAPLEDRTASKRAGTGQAPHGFRRASWAALRT